ncbi:hypothetical protein BST61_g4527 [Cercospora zeina]
MHKRPLPHGQIADGTSLARPPPVHCDQRVHATNHDVRVEHGTAYTLLETDRLGRGVLHLLSEPSGVVRLASRPASFSRSTYQPKWIALAELLGGSQPIIHQPSLPAASTLHRQRLTTTVRDHSCCA